jgi:hypothetical protein
MNSGNHAFASAQMMSMFSSDSARPNCVAPSAAAGDRTQRLCRLRVGLDVGDTVRVQLRRHSQHEMMLDEPLPTT